MGSSAKGHEYFLRHLLGATGDSAMAAETPPELRPQDVVWRDDAPKGKLDLLVNLDFRMTSTGMHSDVVLPAATWYEKYDLSMTDMHPFVHAFNPAVPPPWEARNDWNIFGTIADRFAELAETHLGTRTDVVATPIMHDSPGEISQPHGQVRDWKLGECEPVPGKTMPNIAVVERDYGAVAQKWRALGPLAEKLGSAGKGASWKPAEEVEWLAEKNGIASGGVADGRPLLERPEQVAETILALSGTTNGRLAMEGFESLEKRVGKPLAGLAAANADTRIRFHDTQVQPRTVITSPEWSGIDEHGRRYAPFTINAEHLKPWHTLSGRMHLYLDHEWMLEYGDGLPAFRPPLHYDRLLGDPSVNEDDRRVDVALPDPAFEVVDPLRIPRQPPHADPVPRWLRPLDEPAGRAGARRQRQRLDRGLQPERDRLHPCGRDSPGAQGVSCSTTPRTAT